MSEYDKQELHRVLTQYNELNREVPGYEIEIRFEELVNYLGEFYPIEILEKLLAFYKKKSLTIEDMIVPDIMYRMGTNTYKSQDDGSKVDLSTYYTIDIKDTDKFYEYLESIGSGVLIKKEYRFDKGANMKEFEEKLKSSGFEFDEELSVNTNSLKALMKKHLESGGVGPELDVAQIKPFTKAKIKIKGKS